MKVSDYFAEELKRINPFLDQQLQQAATEDSKLKQAVAYSLLAGGKRVRPLLVYATADALGVPLAHADHLAAAIEMIHAYSLIHDDLPSMDDDDLRRGRATCHIAFDEATAILAGDALQAMAFEILAQTPSDASKIVPMIQIMAKACGLIGMAGGQSLDLEAENKAVQLEQLQKIHAAKTGALLTACVDMVCVLSDNQPAAKELHQLFFTLRDELNQTFVIVTHNNELANIVATLNQLFSRLNAAFQRERYFASDAAHELKTPLLPATPGFTVLMDTPVVV